MKNLFTVVEAEEEFLREIAKNYYKLDTHIKTYLSFITIIRRIQISFL
jgi:hypothetical protein